MQYKFTAADMDGTLLNDANEITTHTVEIHPPGSLPGTDFLHMYRATHSGSRALSKAAGHPGTRNHL